MGHLELEEVAIEAAKLYSQKWDEIPAHSKEKWKQAVQTAETQSHAAGETFMETCAQDAYRAWAAEQTPVVEALPIAKPKPVERKPVNKVDPEPPKAPQPKK